jgi:probable rRNA maturation factor
MIHVEITNEIDSPIVDGESVRTAVHEILSAANVSAGEVSVAVVDDSTIHELNRRHLQHDYATDVLSFLLESRPGYLEGEVVVSADTAERSATQFGWPAADELVLYVVHGTLHLVGYDDQTPEDKAVMRAQEKRVLATLGLTPRYDAVAEVESEETHHGGSTP